MVGFKLCEGFVHSAAAMCQQSGAEGRRTGLRALTCFLASRLCFFSLKMCRRDCKTTAHHSSCRDEGLGARTSALWCCQTSQGVTHRAGGFVISHAAIWPLCKNCRQALGAAGTSLIVSAVLRQTDLPVRLRGHHFPVHSIEVAAVLQQVQQEVQLQIETAW
jgi:hypothetical protein